MIIGSRRVITRLMNLRQHSFIHHYSFQLSLSKMPHSLNWIYPKMGEKNIPEYLTLFSLTSSPWQIIRPGFSASQVAFSSAQWDFFREFLFVSVKIWLIRFLLSTIDNQCFLPVYLNKSTVYNSERLQSLMRRPEGRFPLLTVRYHWWTLCAQRLQNVRTFNLLFSNHHSCFDDPTLWGTLKLKDVCSAKRMRWSLAVTQTRPWLAQFIQGKNLVLGSWHLLHFKTALTFLYVWKVHPCCPRWVCVPACSWSLH